jgi:hypothetical protein
MLTLTADNHTGGMTPAGDSVLWEVDMGAIHRRLLGPANKSTQNLAEHKRGFRI